MRRWLWVAVLLIASLTVQAQAELPASDWYTVIWQQETDTLHWLNAEGEQWQIERPRLPAENTTANATQLYLAPDAKTLLITAPLRSAGQGIGFYDVAGETLINFHQTPSNEQIVPPAGDVFSEDGAYAGLVLQTRETRAWRILIFETMTGNVPYTLVHDPRTIPQAFVTELNRYPQILSLMTDADQAATVDVRFQMVDPNQPLRQSYGWRPMPEYPAGNIRSDWLSFNTALGFDMMPDGSDLLLAGINPTYGLPMMPDVGNTVSVQADANSMALDLVSEGLVRNPRYLNNGRWIGYQQVSDSGAQWHIITREGDVIADLDAAVIDLQHTPDGALAITDAGAIYHLTDDHLTLERLLWQSEAPFKMIYSTPIGATVSTEMMTQP